jgi:hypothetical protein
MGPYASKELQVRFKVARQASYRISNVWSMVCKRFAELLQ